MLSKDIFVPLTICIDQTRRALVIVLPCYGTLEIVSVIIIIIIIMKESYPSSCSITNSESNIIDERKNDMKRDIFQQAFKLHPTTVNQACTWTNPGHSHHVQRSSLTIAPRTSEYDNRTVSCYD